MSLRKLGFLALLLILLKLQSDVYKHFFVKSIKVHNMSKYPKLQNIKSVKSSRLVYI